MWERFKRWVYIEYYWWRRKHQRKAAPSGKKSVALPLALVMVAVVGLSVLLSKIIASIYRSFIPFVSGPQIADAYWASIASALKLSLFLIGVVGVCILVVFMKFLKRMKKK